MEDVRTSVPERPVRLLDQLRRHMRDRGYAWTTEKTYIHWIRRFMIFHGKRHPASLSGTHVEQHPSHLAGGRRGSRVDFGQPLTAVSNCPGPTLQLP